MSKVTNEPFVQCAFCGVEHMQGNCLEFSEEDFVKWMKRHGMSPNITFHDYTREVEEDE